MGISHVFLLVLLPMGEEDECLDVSALQAHADGPTTYGIQSHYRSKEREAFVRWDCGERVRRAALRKAAPVVGSFQVGRHRLVLPRSTGRRTRTTMERWIGSEKDKNSLCETQPRTCWVICDSLSVCVAIDRLRPCTSSRIVGFSPHANERVPHLSRQTSRHNKVSSTNALRSIRQSLVRYTVSTKMTTMTTQQNKPEPQRQELKPFKTYPFCFKRNIVSIRGMDFFK